MKKLLLLSLLPLTLALQACDDRQVAAGVGFAGGVVIGASFGHRHYYNDPYYGGGYYGGGYYGRGYYGGGYYGGGYYQPTSLTTTEPSNKLVSRYHLSEVAANKVATAFQKGAKSDFSGFQKIGLSKDDLVGFSNNQMPSDQSVSAMSRSLQMSHGQVRTMLQKMMTEVQTAQSQQAIAL